MMNMKRMRKALSCILCMVLIVAMALVTTGCDGSAGNQTTAATTVGATPTEAPASEAVENEITVLGEGSKVFEFSVVDLEGKETWFEIHTDEEMVGAALMDVGLIVGEEGPYGLYVKEVNGISADYDKDKTYWAFFVNDEYGMTGVDMTPIEEGTVYSFCVSK